MPTAPVHGCFHCMRTFNSEAEHAVHDALRAALEFLIAVYGWLTSGLLEACEYHAEPWVQARWTVSVA